MSFPVFTLTPAIAALVTPAPATEWRFHADAVLGTRLDIFVACASPVTAQRGADAAMAEIARLDRLLSWRDADSELARLNCAERFAVSPELFEVLARAAHWRAVSGGAFDERLGLATRLWRAGDEAGARAATEAARTAIVYLEPGRIVARAPGAVLDLDAIAKGYVVDRALAALRLAAPEITAALVSIGGDMAGWRADPASGAWRIGLPEAGEVADNAPLAAVVDLAQGAIATSGRGPRDVTVDGRRIGPALSPLTAAPAEGQVCATARARCAMDADALATIALVLPPNEALAIADATADAALRITGADGQVHTSARWQERPAPLGFLPQAKPPESAPAQGAERWPIDWRLAIWYRLPERRDRDRDFREPYMAVWVTDANNKPVRTLFMVGQNAKWQKDNYIWWSGYRINAADVIDARSEATAPTGRYAFMWEGRDDNDQRVAAGKYTIHIETSRERGRHTHRTMEIEIGKDKFEKTMPATLEEGGFTAFFGHYNDVHDYAPGD